VSPAADSPLRQRPAGGGCGREESVTGSGTADFAGRKRADVLGSEFLSDQVSLHAAQFCSWLSFEGETWRTAQLPAQISNSADPGQVKESIRQLTRLALRGPVCACASGQPSRRPSVYASAGLRPR
jgi:hypothetical protein